jgi:hypothetical protein
MDLQQLLDALNHQTRKVNDLRAENERLRGAQFEVIARAVLVEGTTWKDTANEMAAIAKAALDAAGGSNE